MTARLAERGRSGQRSILRIGAARLCSEASRPRAVRPCYCARWVCAGRLTVTDLAVEQLTLTYDARDARSNGRRIGTGDGEDVTYAYYSQIRWHERGYRIAQSRAAETSRAECNTGPGPCQGPSVLHCASWRHVKLANAHDSRVWYLRCRRAFASSQEGEHQALINSASI
jgi:hypothetical protein